MACVQLGTWDLYPWHKSPYPDEYAALPKIFLCNFCLQYFKSPEQLQVGGFAAEAARPPGAKNFF
jgi:histone acetyltransferase HTATIP